MIVRRLICVLGLLGLAILAVAAPAGLGLVLAFLIFAVSVDRLIALLNGTLNRVCRSCRNSIDSRVCGPSIADAACDVNERLRETLTDLRADEARVASARASHRCSEAELARAVSKRLFAEIELIRAERMPRPFSEITRGEG